MGHNLISPVVNPWRHEDSAGVRGSGGASPPLAPTLDSVTPGDTQNTIAFTPPSGSPDSYNLYWSLTSPVSKASNKIAGVTSPRVHSSLTNGTPYYYAVTAVKSGLESVLSNEGNGTPQMAAFSITVTTTASPQDFKLYLAGANALHVHWGDTNEDDYTGSDGVKTHAYANAGTYTVTFVSGTATRIAFGETGCTPTLVKSVATAVADWLGLTSALKMFASCANCTTWAANFMDAASAAITNMQQTFYQAGAFNQNIGGWNTGNVTTMARMFEACASFNQDIGAWNVGNVNDMQYMFYGCTAFNQNIASWSVAKVTTMHWMFASAAAFNQPVGSWATTALLDADGMFYQASAFNQSLAGWNVTAATNLTSLLLSSAFAKANYDPTLVAWGAQAVHNGLSCHFGTAHYSAGDPTTAHDHLTGVHSWTITDGGTP